MSKPHVICHMTSSLDGKILPRRWAPTGVHDPGIYDRLHREMGGGSWLVGRVTAQEFARREAYPNEVAETFAREPWLPRKGAKAYAIMVDGKGKVAWGRADVDGEPIVVVLTEQVSDAHLAGLHGDGVGYVFAGKTEIDLALLLGALQRELGIERLLLEGGGGMNGSFLRAGLIDEISLILEPAVDARRDTPTTFDGGDTSSGPAPISGLSLTSHNLLEGARLWLRYAVDNEKRAAR
ncbi:dihydrofolate reductase family protein (plasmid) [Roseomonas sp. OT10]|uniref:dihydrofolate reductase family protein n=1 Tax=Roseomonas cutis TaxID=2897332 RepID=UPI001E4C8575|nr:dihydrofolate reductase family protein [Roseomonas sp. OT10]UFN51562.1 dihydrofolate reductase family protein [Roseomonas sp. OT10]